MRDGNYALALSEFQSYEKRKTFCSSRLIFSQGFYNPVSDAFIEPNLPGISYSFTDPTSQNAAGEYVGWYEEAYYRAIANRGCP